MLKAIDLSKNYNGSTALDSLNLNIESGEIYCLLGANGAGKTTTINLFLNFVDPTGGHALSNGLDVTREPLETKKFIAYIPEQVNLYRNLSGFKKSRVFLGFAPPDGNLTFGSPFGESSQMLNRGLGGLNALYQIGGPRSIQLVARIQF